MANILLGFILVFLFGLGVFLWINSKGIPRKDTDLSLAFEGLLNCSSDRPFLIIRKLFKKEFVQFFKFEKDDGSSSICLAFPIKEWSKPYERKLIACLRKSEFEYSILDEKEDYFIVVDFGDDVYQAQQCSQIILRSVFNFPRSCVYRVHLEP